MSPVNFSELLNPQWEAGTGRKRKIPYTGVMAGSAVNAPEEQRLSKLTELENERITTIATQFDKEQALRREAMGEAEAQAKTGSLIQMGGLGLQGAYLATRPEVKELVTGGIEGVRNLVGAGVPTTAAGDLTAGGYIPATKIFSGGVDTGITAGAAGAEATATGIGEGSTLMAGEAAADLAPGVATGAGMGLGTAVAYGVPTIGAAYALDQFLNEGRVTETITEAAEDTWSFIEDIGSSIGDFFSDSCIIITACTHPQSNEVNLAREYRDRFMNKSMLRGYYHIAERIVPLMKLIPQYNHYIRETLVKYLIDYGNYAMGRTNKCHLKARIITLDFLAYCERIGSQFIVYRRMNGEVL